MIVVAHGCNVCNGFIVCNATIRNSIMYIAYVLLAELDQCCIIYFSCFILQKIRNSSNNDYISQKESVRRNKTAGN